MITLSLDQLVGRWHVLATNFPMWLKGDKTQPTFEYAKLADGRLDDTVAYLKAGKRHTIRGIDTQHTGAPTYFTWRGRGWLKLFTSHWAVDAIDPLAGQWAVISFSKTLATPEGVDVIAREVSAEAVEKARAVIDADPVLAAKARGLTPLR